MPSTVATANEPPRTRCWRCERAIDPDDCYCRRCGEGQGAFLAWYYRPLYIALLTLTALGPFTLPLVWRTPQLDRTAKWIASLMIIAITGYFGWRLVVAVGDLATLLSGS